MLIFECSENLDIAAVRATLSREIKSNLHCIQILSRPAAIDREDDLRPCRTIVSPPTICIEDIPAEPERIVAGWIADAASPIAAVGQLEPRVEVWNEPINPEEPASIALLRLLARRLDARLHDNAPTTTTGSKFTPIQQALMILRRNDTAVPVVLPREHRSAAIITQLRHQRRR